MDEIKDWKEEIETAYTGFAEVYDRFMDNVPYEEWCSRVLKILAQFGIKDGLAAELGCGTGSMTELLSAAGFDMIGIDNSADMLELAMEKRAASGREILYLLQDMREFELYGTVRAVVSICDSINYITEPEDLREVFGLVNNYLDPEGIFVFDMNTQYKYETLLADHTFAESRDEASFIWENEYDAESRINEYGLTVFVREPGKEDLYRRYEEVHYQRAYSLEEIREAMESAGLEFLAAYDGYTNRPAEKTSERICIVARESGKERKEADQ